MTEVIRHRDALDPPWGKFVLGGLVAAVVAMAVIAYLAVRDSDSGQSLSLPNRAIRNTPFITPGIRQPDTVPAVDAKLDEHAQVIGISAGDKHRAYVIRAFDQPMWHVVNDLLDDIPVSVTYCDRCDMARAFTSPRRGSSLELMLGGWLNDRMLLRLGDAFFPQDGDEASLGRGLETTDQRDVHATPVLTEYPHERTTWKAWKTDHPDTDVYTGFDQNRVMEWGPNGK
jgi:hypothetical protein